MLRSPRVGSSMARQAHRCAICAHPRWPPALCCAARLSSRSSADEVAARLPPLALARALRSLVGVGRVVCRSALGRSSNKNKLIRGMALVAAGGAEGPATRAPACSLARPDGTATRTPAASFLRLFGLGQYASGFYDAGFLELSTLARLSEKDALELVGGLPLYPGRQWAWRTVGSTISDCREDCGPHPLIHRFSSVVWASAPCC